MMILIPCSCWSLSCVASCLRASNLSLRHMARHRPLAMLARAENKPPEEGSVCLEIDDTLVNSSKRILSARHGNPYKHT